jgi:outer membrane protein TolC
MRSLKPLVFLLLLAAPTLRAQTRLALDQAVATALEKNPERKAAVFHRQASAASVKEARAALLPKIAFHEGYLRSNDPVFVFGSKLRQQRFGAGDFALNILNTPTPFGNFSTGFSGEWQLFDSGANWLRVSQSKLMSTMSQHRLERTEQQLVYRVIDAYMGLLLAARQLQVAEDAVKTSQAILDRSQARFESGMVVESDLLSAKVDFAARQQERIRSQSAVQIARANLNRELGVPLDTDCQPAEILAERVFPTASESDLEKLALERRPDFAVATLQSDLQRKSESIAKAALGPRVNAFAGWQTDNPHFAGGGGNNWTAGLEVQVDLFSGGAKLARIQAERALANEASALRDSMASGVRVDVRKAYLEFDSAQQQISVARAAVEQAKESLRISQNRYEGGLITISDLLRTSDASRRAETDYWQAVYRLHTRYANLELSTGTLDANSPVVKP